MQSGYVGNHASDGGVYAYMFVCVRERQRQRDRESETLVQGERVVLGLDSVPSGAYYL